MKILLYIGRFRFPLKPGDIGVECFEAIRRSRHEIAALLVDPDDPLRSFATDRGVNVIPLPPEMHAPVAEMRRYFSAPPFCDNVESFLAAIHEADPDIGAVYCGAWVPPALRVTVPMGFINLHPGPLPELSGYDPEKFMILADVPEGRGTVHRVADRFDTGNILSFTPPVPLARDTTTPELAKAISRAGFQTLVEVLDTFAESRFLIGMPQDESRRGYATRKLGYVESVLRLDEDTHRKMNSRLRAFNSLDDGMPLKMRLDGRYTIVYDLETHENTDFGEPLPGAAGQMIGRYAGSGAFHDAPIFRTREGAVVLLTGPSVESHDTDFFLPEDRLIAAGPRIPKTTVDGFRME